MYIEEGLIKITTPLASARISADSTHQQLEHLNNSSDNSHMEIEVEDHTSSHPQVRDHREDSLEEGDWVNTLIQAIGLAGHIRMTPKSLKK